MKEKLGKARDEVVEFARKAKTQACDAGRKAMQFATENKELVLMGIPLAIAAVRTSQSLVVSKRVKDERNRMDRSIYDRKAGHHWDLRRKPSNAELAEFDRRRDNGENAYDILRSMRLLKR